jgi:AcrR family transcriptional regulator
MTVQPGLRAQKKQRTRDEIAAAARRLFERRGFDGVTVAEIAREAGVAEKTVFNYFPTKEDLFYSRLEAFEEELLTAVREREPGASALAAFRDFLTGRRGVFDLADDDEATRRLHDVSVLIAESPALLARERLVFERYADSLARLLAEETGADPHDAEPRAAANALLGLHRALIDYVRRRALEGAPASEVGPEVRGQAKRAFARLEAGLGDYGVRPPVSSRAEE